MLLTNVLSGSVFEENLMLKQRFDVPRQRRHYGLSQET